MAVMGCVENTAFGGYPSASFVIDGQNDGTSIAASPSITDFFCNFTFFTSPNLPDGEHTLVVTNLNGTRPNVLWFDWIWYISSAISNSTSARCASSKIHNTIIHSKLTATFQWSLRSADCCYLQSQSESSVIVAQLDISHSDPCSYFNRSLWERNFCGGPCSEPWSHCRRLCGRGCSAHSGCSHPLPPLQT